MLHIVEKALLRPPLLLALYLLDLEQCEIIEIPEDEEVDESSSGSSLANSNVCPAAVAALHLWVIDLVESVACWL